jgi:hypothetical protein
MNYYCVLMGVRTKENLNNGVQLHTSVCANYEGGKHELLTEQGQ